MKSPAVLNTPAGVVRYTIPADLTLVAALRQRFMDTISNGEMTEVELYRWELVFQELVVNAIRHGAREDASQSVSVEWGITHDAIVIAARDPGNGPPDTMLESPTCADPEACSGRGLFIIAEFADQLRWWRGTGGFCLEVVKHYPSQGLPLPGNPELDSVLEELSTCYESLSVFHKLTENLIESGNLRDFIEGSLGEFLSLHPNDRIFIQGAPTIPETIRNILAPASWFLDPNDANHSLKELGNITRETVWESFEDLVRQGYEFKSLRAVEAGCVFPIVAGDIHFGALIVLRKSSATSHRFRSLGTMRTLADLCGIACANAHLTHIREESQRDLRELEIAVEIQKALLPILPTPVSQKWQVSINQESAQTVAGDYAIARPDPDGNLVVAMIDVMGKGVSAALLASIFRTAFEMSLHIRSSHEILETINRTLCNQLGELTMFITCAVARVSADGKSLDHASAGHCPTFYYRADGTRTFLHPSGPPLGIIPDTEYSGDYFPLEGGERFVFGTDGCYEWDRYSQDFGWDRFVEVVDSHRNSSAGALWAHLRERIRNQYGPNLEDDCTLLTIDINP